MRWILRLKGNKRRQTDDNDDIHSIFYSIFLHDWEGNMKGLPLDWVFSKFTFRSNITILHMELHQQQVIYLKMLQTCHLNNLDRGSEMFRDIIF